ncbi:hypothetical protein PCE1_000367 [Barthelona sp. PCE]
MVKSTQKFREMNVEEIMSSLKKEKNELLKLRVSKVASGGASKLLQMKNIRREIARMKTIMREKQLEELRTKYEGKKYAPICLRTKGTRAMRRALSEEQKAMQTVRQQKRANSFRDYTYAIEA